MARDKLTEYSATASENTVCGDVNIAENSALPSDMNNFAREVMSHLKAFSDGTDAITGLTVDGNIKLDGNYPTGTNNVALGNTALDDGSLSGGNNTAIGSAALSATTSGSDNTAAGFNTLATNTTGSGNTAIGKSALSLNASGNDCVAVGQQALEDSTGSNNTAVGYAAMLENTSGTGNLALGKEAMKVATTALNSVMVGYQAGRATTTGSWNTFCGANAGDDNTTGFGNSFFGTNYSGGAGSAVTTGSRNTIIGGYTGNQDSFDIRTSSNNIVLSDGDGNARGYYNSSGARWKFRGNANGYFGVDVDQETTGGSPYGLLIQYPNTAPDNHNGQFLACHDSSSVRFRIYNDGDAQNHDNDYGGLSDQKLKEQIADASSQWDDIKALTVRKYKFKTDVADADTDSDALFQIGVIAQEVETAGMSGLVSESPDIDADGNDLGTVTKGVKYSVLYMKAVKALQEAMTRIETLETKVAALEAE